MIYIKDYQEKFPIQFDFTKTLDVETISAITVDVVDITNADLTPTVILATTATNTAGVITQWVNGGSIDSVYHLRCKITTSGGRVLVLPQDIQVIKK